MALHDWNQFDIAELQAVVDWAWYSATFEGNAQEHEGPIWDQEFWCSDENECGTAFCAAGYSAYKNGLIIEEPYTYPDGHKVKLVKLVNLDKVLREDEVQRYVEIDDECGSAESDDYAYPLIGQRILGIKDYEAGALFRGLNTIDELINIAASIARRYGEVLRDPRAA